MKKISLISLVICFTLNLNATSTTEQQVFLNKTEKNEEIIEVDKSELFKEKSSQIIKTVLKKRTNPSSLSRGLTKKYYNYHNYQPFFINENGIKPLTYTLLENIKTDPVLKPYIHKLFNIEKIELNIEEINNSEISIDKLINLDFMLVSTYHQYMRYLSRGIIDWKAFQEELKELDEKKEIIANWKKYDVRKNIRKLLYEAIKEDNILLAINKVNYTFPKAKELSEIIKEYEQIAQNGGYIKVPKVKKSMKKGNYYPEIRFLRERLVQSNDLEDTECFIKDETQKEVSNNLFIKEQEVVTIEEDTKTISLENKEPQKECQELYDEKVFEAVKSFQKSHGLVEDGIIGRNTINRLNTPIEKKIEKIRINLERMRWMPRDLGEKYLIVNIPDYNLKMYKEGKIKLEMPVVVGERRHPTPIFSHRVSAIVLNPYWRIPQRIVKREIIPKLVEDPTYLEQQDIKTFENWSHKSMTYDTSSVDWSMYLDNDLIGTSQSAPMRFIQIPGEKNPLGRMKFMFPNKYSVYLHDTPFKSLFKKKRRAFSHGCIRLSRPHDLLKTIAEEDSVVDYDKAKEILEDIEKTDIDLTKKIPVHIVYLTTWIDEEGKVQFRDDIYNYDKMQSKYLFNKSL